MGEYISYLSHGIDTKAFFDGFNVTIADVSRAAGVSRASASRLPVKHASRDNTQKMVLYLEEISISDYNDAIRQCGDELQGIMKKVKEAWLTYERKERILDEYRKKYGIKRSQPMVDRITIWELLKKMRRG